MAFYRLRPGAVGSPKTSIASAGIERRRAVPSRCVAPRATSVVQVAQVVHLLREESARLMARPRNPRVGKPLWTPIAGFPLFVGDRRTPRIIAANVWACIRHHVENGRRLSTDEKRRALAHLGQANEFFLAANTPHIASRPLLYYYAFLNLAKVLLLAKGCNLPARTEHGIKDPKENARTRGLRFEGQRVRTTRSEPGAIFPRLVQELRLDHSPLAPRSYKVLRLLRQAPGIHRAYMRVTNSGPAFVPIRRIEVRKDDDGIWARFALNTSDPDVRDALPEARRLFGSTLTHVLAPHGSGESWFEAYKGGDRGNTDTALGYLSYFTQRVGLWALLTRQGYRYYFGAFRKAERLPQLCSMFATMFYLGSITRYKPYDFDRIISGRHAWLVNEFLATQPEQFLYVLASTLAGVEVVRPLAS